MSALGSSATPASNRDWGYTTWLMTALRPRMAFRLNADFEDHAEHEYMRFVEEHPVVVYDQVGSGASDLGAYDRRKYDSLNGYADDLVELCRELDVRHQRVGLRLKLLPRLDEHRNLTERQQARNVRHRDSVLNDRMADDLQLFI